MVQKISDNLWQEWSHFLRRVSIFSEMEEDAVLEVAKKLQPLSLPKGATLYRAGDPGDALYVIQSGRVKVVVQEGTGPEKILNVLGRGETFGETGLLSGAPRTMTVKLDASSDFLVLYKKDFETFLKKNPTASFYLSRLISRRLHLAARTPQIPVEPSEVLGFFCDLKEKDQIVFMVNLSIALTEQTRKKILLLECAPTGTELVRSLGMNPILSSPQMLTSEDLRDPKILERLTLIHPSGLEIITLPLKTFSGSLFRALPSFLATLRDQYDWVVIDLKTGALPSPSEGTLDEVSRAILFECDSIFHVFSNGGPAANPLQSLADEKQNKETRSAEASSGSAAGDGRRSTVMSVSSEMNRRKVKTIHLKRDHSTVEADFLVPWSDQFLSHFQRSGRPYLSGPETEPAHRMLNRIARSIGKLQVGLAMGSGAAYGYTIIGMLKVFEREKIPVDYVSGTSMGALLGSFYAAGKTAEEIETISHSITKVWLRKNFLSDLNLPWPHGGILKGQTVSHFLKSVLGTREFKDLKIPFACAATDIMTGDGIVLREGKVWEAVRASLSLPLIFCPYKMGPRFLVDGGLVNPVPISIIASMGADILISINLTSKASERKVSLRRLGIFPAKTPGFSNIFFKMLYTMQYQIASARTDFSQIMIVPETRNFSWIDFHKAKQLIPLGEEAAEEALAKIKSRLPFFADYCRVSIRGSRRASY